MVVLVTGGAGYIGSHAVLGLLDSGHRVVVLDNLSTGNPAVLPDGVPLIRGDIGDQALVRGLVSEYDIDAVMHFAGSIIVPESVADPLKYYDNNTVKTERLIEVCRDAKLGAFIFSSTAAVYGAPERVPVSESAPTVPINPYGRSKLITEWMLADANHAHGLPFIALRYFNVAGADPQGRSGQVTPKATHLIKVTCEVATGKRPHLEIFGTDYDTRDGTCIRDYIHVTDLIDAHLLALKALRDGHKGGIFNCGYGQGFTVKEVVAAMEEACGQSIATQSVDRRPGDAPSIVAKADRIREQLGWSPKHNNLQTIVGSALAWERSWTAPTA